MPCWQKVTHVIIWGHMKVLPIMSQIIGTNFVWVSYFILFLFVIEVVGGHDFWPHLVMCPQ